MSLEKAYLAAVKRGDIQDDAEQRRLLAPMQRVASGLSSWQAWYRVLLPKRANKGLFIAGPVGVGKTFMMDLFYQYLPTHHKLRVHFLRFMQQVDRRLRLLQGQTDPLLTIATEFSQQYKVICVDEFIVEDIAYAMVLAELLQALFANGVVLVATSNTKIDDLYRDGLNRQRFLPALSLLHQHCDEIQIQSERDYRLGKTLALHAYVYPLNARHQALMVQQFQALASDGKIGGEIAVQSRMIPVVRSSQTVAWFDFDVICAMPRCQLDYIEIADRFHTIFVSNIPVLNQGSSNTAVVLLMHLIDILYDRGIRLIISAAVPAAALYESGPMLTEFARTLSRLEEMQSDDYLSRRTLLS